MRLDDFTRWIMPALSAGLIAVFAFAIADAPPNDRVFILPLMIVGATLVVIVTIRHILHRGPVDPERSETGAPAWRVPTILALVVIFVAGIHMLGFFEAALVFLVAAMLVLGERSPARLVLIPLVLLAASYFLFVVALGAPFPPSLLGLD